MAVTRKNLPVGTAEDDAAKAAAIAAVANVPARARLRSRKPQGLLGWSSLPHYLKDNVRRYEAVCCTLMLLRPSCPALLLIRTICLFCLCRSSSRVSWTHSVPGRRPRVALRRRSADAEKSHSTLCRHTHATSNLSRPHSSPATGSYRQVDMTVWEVIKSSLGYTHNETMNIWTHAIGKYCWSHGTNPDFDTSPSSLAAPWCIPILQVLIWGPHYRPVTPRMQCCLNPTPAHPGGLMDIQNCHRCMMSCTS